MFGKTCISAKLIFHINCQDKVLEICAIELETKSSKLIILSVYRMPLGDFNQFIKNLDDALKHLYKPKLEFLITT